MWNKVIVVEEESHGVIGVAFDIDGAIACAKDWNCGALLTCDDRPATEEELFTLSQKVVNKSSIEELNDFFEGYYSFSIFPAWAWGGESHGFLIHDFFIWRHVGGRPLPPRAESSIIPHPRIFVNRYFAQNFHFNLPKSCAIFRLENLKIICYNVSVR